MCKLLRVCVHVCVCLCVCGGWDWQAVTRCLSFPSAHWASDPTVLRINQKLPGWECWGSRKTRLASLVLHKLRQTARSIHGLVSSTALKPQQTTIQHWILNSLQINWNFAITSVCWIMVIISSKISFEAVYLQKAVTIKFGNVNSEHCLLQHMWLSWKNIFLHLCQNFTTPISQFS